MDLCKDKLSEHQIRAVYAAGSLGKGSHMRSVIFAVSGMAISLTAAQPFSILCKILVVGDFIGHLTHERSDP
jgi:hypothetical protein